MPWWTWLCLGVLALSLLATAIFTAVAVTRLKRLGALAEAIRVQLEELARQGEELERRMAHAEARAAEFEQHRAHLDRSLARLQILTSALSRRARGHPPPEGLPAQVTRVGVVDLGTNSTRLLVAEVENGTVSELERRLTITRLGEGVDGRRLLLPTAIARVRNALTDYRRTLDGAGVERTLAVATSAVREAENGEAFLGEVEWSYGFDTRLLSGTKRR